MKRLLWILLVLFTFAPVMAFAAEFRQPEKGTETVSLKSGQTAKNLYIAGSLVNIDGYVSKDLVTAGSTVNINGNVENDLLSAGGNLTIKSNIGQNARVAGSEIVLEGNIGGDLLAAGNNITLKDKATVGGDLLAAGNSIVIDSQIMGSSHLTGRYIEINGVINGDVIIKGVSNLIIGDKAKINGKLKYNSEKEATINSGAQILGGTEFEKTQINKYPRGARTVSILLNVLLSLLTVLIFVLIFPKLSRDFVLKALDKPLIQMAKGFFLLVLMPISIVLLVAIVIGIKIALILLLLYMLLLAIASIFAPIIFGTLILKLVNITSTYQVTWISVIVGVILLALISIIPIIGWFIVAVVFLIALGQIGSVLWNFLENQRK